MKIVCKKCKGTGIIRDPLETIATLGISALFDWLAPTDNGKVECHRCKGKGYLKL